MGLSRSTYYYRPRGPSAQEQKQNDDLRPGNAWCRRGLGTSGSVVNAMVKEGLPPLTCLVLLVDFDRVKTDGHGFGRSKPGETQGNL